MTRPPSSSSLLPSSTGSNGSHCLLRRIKGNNPRCFFVRRRIVQAAGLSLIVLLVLYLSSTTTKSKWFEPATITTTTVIKPSLQQQQQVDSNQYDNNTKVQSNDSNGSSTLFDDSSGLKTKSNDNPLSEQQQVQEQQHESDPQPQPQPQPQPRSSSSSSAPPPQIAWLLSFPNSGTTYTMHLIQQYTRTTTATNYGQEQTVTVNSTSIPVQPSSPDGPFYRYLDENHTIPSDYILTKTHCGGFCDSCRSVSEYLETTESFELACRTGKKYVDGQPVVPSTYPKHTAVRAVHLFRDPFDNIVARLHLRERRWNRADADPNHAKRTQLFNSTRDGFRTYCEWMGSREKDLVNVVRKYLSNKQQNDATDAQRNNTTVMTSTSESSQSSPDQHVFNVDDIDKIPCFADFVRYVWWHEHALQMIEQLPIHDVHTVYYEDYATDWNTTVQNLFQFLNLQPAVGAEPPSFITGKHYIEYYSDEEVRIVQRFVQALSSGRLWDEHLKRYFPIT